MHIARRFSNNDVSGVMGLLAFLADKDACAARLAELQGMVDAADAEIAKAASISSDSAQVMVAAEKLRNDAEAVAAALEKSTGVAHAAVMEREARVASQEVKLRAEGDRLAAWQNGLEHREKVAAVKADEFDAREKALAALEQEVADMRAEYEDKLAKFKALAA